MKRPRLKPEVCSGHIGAAAELIVCADLLRRGYIAYRNVSPNGDVDIIATKENGFYTAWRIQVKSNHGSAKNCDLLAIVSGNVVSYYPVSTIGQRRQPLDMDNLIYKHGTAFSSLSFAETFVERVLEDPDLRAVIIGKLKSEGTTEGTTEVVGS